MSENNSLQNNNGKPIQLNHNMEILNTQTPSNKVDIFKIDQQSSNYGNNDFHLDTKGLVIPKPNITLDKIVVNSHQDTIKVSKVIGESEDDNKKQKLDKRIVKFRTNSILTNNELIDRVLPFPPSRKRNLLERFLHRKEIDVIKNGHKIDHRQEFDTNSTDTSKFSSLKSKDPLQKDGTETLIQQRKNTKKEDGEMLEQKTYSNDNKQKEKTRLVSSC